MIIVSMCGATAVAALLILVVALSNSKRGHALEHLAFETFKARYPPTLLDLDVEVERLRRDRATVEAEIALAKKQAASERERDRSLLDDERQKSQKQEQTRKADWETRFREAMAELIRLQAEVEGLSDEAEMQSFGLYKPRYEFARAEEYKAQLEKIRESQKQMLRAKDAAQCPMKWEVGGSVVEGRKMVDRQLKLMLRAFNGECDGATANVSWKSVVPLRERIRKSFEAVNKLGESVQCEIAMPYLKLRLDELDLAYEAAEKVHAEKEEQRELREHMREEEKAVKELEREKDDAEREGDKYGKALEKARAEIAASNAGERAVLDSKIEKLEKLLAKAEERKQRAISQAELTKLGHVYILSNEGAFGPNVFKIGMTRRLDPQDRVDELGSASVPFRFDVHAIIRSDDAPGLEQKLHQALEPHRINLVNHRKEYFRVPLEKVVDLVIKHHGEVQLTRIAEAADYRKSLAIRAEREAMVAGKIAHASAVSRADQLKARYEELKKATA